MKNIKSVRLNNTDTSIARALDIDDGMYDALGDFAICLGDGLVEKSLSEEGIHKAYKVMNTMGHRKN